MHKDVEKEYGIHKKIQHKSIVDDILHCYPSHISKGAKGRHKNMRFLLHNLCR